MACALFYLFEKIHVIFINHTQNEFSLIESKTLKIITLILQ